MTDRRFWIRLSAACCVVASMGGCATLGNNESQLFSRASRYESASITYRVVPAAAGDAPGDVVLASHSAPAAGDSTGRKMTLAIRYPHPAGRAGFARVELVVQRGKSNATGAAAWLPGWVDRARRFANDNMPGVSMTGDVQEALGLDLAVADLDHLVARLQQPIQTAAKVSRTKEVAIAAKINGTPLSLRNAPVAELDALIGRVRREGSLISHSAATMDWEIEAPAIDAESPRAASAVIQASYTESATQRLPPVE